MCEFWIKLLILCSASFGSKLILDINLTILVFFFFSCTIIIIHWPKKREIQARSKYLKLSLLVTFPTEHHHQHYYHFIFSLEFLSNICSSDQVSYLVQKKKKKRKRSLIKSVRTCACSTIWFKAKPIAHKIGSPP